MEPGKLDQVRAAVDELLYDNRFSPEAIRQLKEAYIYNCGESGKIGAKYMIGSLLEKSGQEK